MAVKPIQINLQTAQKTLGWTEANLIADGPGWAAELRRFDGKRAATETVPIGRCRQQIAQRLVNAFVRHDCGPDAMAIYEDERTEIVTLTPAMACALVRLNRLNRVISENFVDRYANEIAKGGWLLTGQAIGVASNRLITDGQHRIWAVIMAGVPIRVRVAFGLDEVSRDVVDVGNHRRVEHIWDLHGIAYAKEKRTIVGGILELADGNQVLMSARLGEQILDRHRDAVEWMVSEIKKKWHGPRPQKPTQVALALAYEKHPQEIAILTDHVRTGLGLTDGAAATMLYRYIQSTRGIASSERPGHRSYQARDSYTEAVQKSLRACLAHVRGETLQKLYANPDGLAYFVPNKKALVGE